MILTLLLLFSFFIFLFCVFSLSREDIVLMRKRTSIEDIFTISFIGFIIALLSSRLFFVLFHLKWAYANPLVFFLFPYFPGLSLAGGIIGSMFFLSLATRKHRMPLARIIDIFSLALLVSLSAGMFINQMLLSIIGRHIAWVDILLPIIDALFFIFCLRLFRTNKSKDGLIGSLIILFLSTTFILRDLLVTFRHIQQSFGENALFLFLFVFSIAIILAQSTVFHSSRRGKQ